MGYYFISIGGSGARVLEALTHLCVAGHKLPIKTKFIENEGQGDVYVPVVNETLADAKKAAHAAAVEEMHEAEAKAEEGGDANES